MNRRQRDRTRRAAAVIAINGRFAMNDQVARAMVALAEMQRQAEEFSWARPSTPTACKPTAVACNGTGHAGAI
jgi:hypothetical protein